MSIDEKLKNLTNLVEELRKDVNKLIECHMQVNDSCKNMDRHIQFVEETYDNLRHSKPIMLASKMSSFWKGANSIENTSN